MPPLVTMTFPALCPSFSGCGGSLPGTYIYTTACVDDAEFDGMIAAAGLCGASNVTISNKSGTIQGGLLFTANQVSRVVSGSINFTISLGGPVCGVAATCPIVSQNIMQYGFTGTCQFDTTALKCVCPLTRSLSTASAENYTTNGNQVTTTGSRTRVYDYCLTSGGNNLAYREITAFDGGMYIKDPGYFSLTK